MASQDRPTHGPQGGLDATLPHHHTAYKIIGVAMAVHNQLGPGHREEVYQQAMFKRLPEAGLATEEQVPVAVTLDGGDLLTYYLDLLVEQAVIVELKAHSHPLTNDDLLSPDYSLIRCLFADTAVLARSLAVKIWVD